MERLSDVLRRSAIAEENTARSSAGADSPAAETAPDAERCPVCDGLGWVSRDLPLDDPGFGQLIPCVCRAEELKRERFHRLRRYGQLEPFVNVTFESLEAELANSPVNERNGPYADALTRARKYAAEPEGWLVLHGPSGSGKTNIAAAVANDVIGRGLPALFVSVPDFLDYLRAAYAPNAETPFDSLFEQVKEAPLLILDDLGVQSATPWAQEKLFQVLNQRFIERRPMVITLSGSLMETEPHLLSRLTAPGLSTVLATGAVSGRLRATDALDLPRFAEMTFGSFDSRKYDALDRHQRQSIEGALRTSQTYAEQPDGWLVFTGDNGVGKTHLAAAIANECRARGTETLFVVVPDLLDHLRYTFGPQSDVSYDELFEGVRTVPLLVLDDLGAHATTPWAQEKLYQIINYRYNARLSTVVTMNISLDELAQDEPRVASRLADPRFSITFNIDVPNYLLRRNLTEPLSESRSRRGRG